MALTRADFTALTVDLQSIFSEAAANKVAMMEGKKIFDIKDDNRRTHLHRLVHGLAGIAEVAEDETYPTVSSNQGDGITFTQRQFAAAVKVTKQIMMFDLYDEVKANVKTITDDGFDKIDQSFADVLLNGWGTSYTDVYGGTVTSTGPDGESLINSAHSNNVTSTTYDNRILDEGVVADSVLDRAAIVAERARAMKFLDPQGIMRPIILDTIITGPTLEDLVERVLFSQQLSGSANNDINPLKGKMRNIITWPRIDLRSDAVDTSAYWFMGDSRNLKETFKAFFTQRPRLDPPEVVYLTKTNNFSVDYLYSWGFAYAPYIRGSRGTIA